MKKIIVTLLLALSLAVLPSYTALAAENVVGVDFSSRQNEEIDQLSDALYSAYGLEAFLVVDEGITDPESTEKLAKDTFSSNASGSNGMCLAITDGNYYFYRTGTATDLLNDASADSLWDYMEDYPSYYNKAFAYFSYLNMAVVVPDGYDLQINRDDVKKPAAAVGDIVDDNSKGNNAVIIIVVASVAVIAVALFLMVRKKKKG